MCLQVLRSKFEHDTPVFLKFINMMVNDATLQLDEGLQVSQYININHRETSLVQVNGTHLVIYYIICALLLHTI